MRILDWIADLDEGPALFFGTVAPMIIIIVPLWAVGVPLFYCFLIAAAALAIFWSWAAKTDGESMTNWQPTWEKDPQTGYFITPADGGGFLIASTVPPRFCFFSVTLDGARERVADALRFYERARLKLDQS